MLGFCCCNRDYISLHAQTDSRPQALHLSLNKDLVPSLMRKVYGGAVEGLEEDLEVAADVVQVRKQGRGAVVVGAGASTRQQRQ